MCPNSRAIRGGLFTPSYNKVVEARKNANIQLDKETADIVADAMMKWAESLGVTHFCHWFQPLSGVTAQKQDACAAHPSR